MRARRFITVTLSLCFAAALAGACGGSTSSNNASTDSGIEAAADTGVKDTGVADVVDSSVADTSPGCDLDADLTAEIPDAALDDAGDITTGSCLGCANTSATCGPEIAACNADCGCKTAIPVLLNCVAGGGSLENCAILHLGTLPTSSRNIGVSILTCIQSGPCASLCIPSGLLDGGDGGD